MKTKKRILLIILIAGLILVCYGGYRVFHGLDNLADYLGYDSAISWLNVAIRERLQDYYHKHQTYPGSLSDLNIPFHEGDGTTPEMIQEFSYSTDGHSYQIEYRITHGTKTRVRRESGTEGKDVEIYFDEWQMNEKQSPIP